MAVRIQDDIYDGEGATAPLIFVSDEFLVEAQSTFSTLFQSSSPFWIIYHRYMTTTSRAIVECDDLLQTPMASAQTLLPAYARVSALFKIGAAAVCIRSDRMKQFSQVSRFADALAAAGQILDDLDDILEDLKRGRRNYAARLLSIPMITPDNEGEVRKMVAHRLHAEHHRALIIECVQSQLRQARRASYLLEIPEATKYVERCEASLVRLEQASAAAVRRSLPAGSIPRGW
jgi:hypothetical protein